MKKTRHESQHTEEPSWSLAPFISSHMKVILKEWDSFARHNSPDPNMTDLALRDHAEDILKAIVLDMQSAQNDGQQQRKSHGEEDCKKTHLMRKAAEIHASTRLDSGYDAMELMAEYRALRASVLRLWFAIEPQLSEADLEDMLRFNESIDQSVAMAMECFATLVDRSRQLFLCILGHDLRNPLAVISTYAQVMYSWEYHNKDSDTMATAISKSAKSMDQIIADLIDFSSGHLGASMPIMPAPTELCRLCQEVSDEISTAFPDSHVDLCLPEHEINAHWDKARMWQMLSNLLSNACQHGSGRIEFRVAEDGDDVRLVVWNEEGVIDAELLPTIFDPLVRSPSQLKPESRTGSLGLGLYIVREVVRSHGGTIEVESTEESGTTFTVRLPRQCKA